MKLSFKVISIISFIPLWILLVIGIGPLYLWLEGIYQLIIGDIPPGNPDELTYESVLVPTSMYFMGIVGSFGIYSFLSGSKTKASIVWRSKKAFYIFAIAGFIPCIWLTYNEIPGTNKWLNITFTFFVPLVFLICSYKLRFHDQNG